MRLWGGGPLSVVRTPLDLPLGLFGVWAFITWTLSLIHHGPFFRPGIFHEGIRGFFFLGVNVLGAFFFSTQMAKAPEGPRLQNLILLVGGVSAAYGILQYFGIDPLWKGGINPFAGRPVSTYGNPNFLSSVLVLLLPLLARRFLTSRRAGPLLGWGSLGILYFAALIATMTRSSWIGLGAALVLYAILDWSTLRISFLKGLLWGGGIVTLLLLWPASPLGSTNPFHRMTELWKGVTGASIYAPWHQRLLIWRSAWDMWTERPWTGKGWGLFELFYPYYQGRLLPMDLFQTFRTHANNAHELILEIGSQSGIVGLGLLVWMIWIMGTIQKKANHRLSPADRSLSSALLAGVGGMAADNVFGNVSLFFAVPGFLFFWNLGQWAAFHGKDHVIQGTGFLRRLSSVSLVVLMGFGIFSLYRKLRAERAYFRASQISPNEKSRAREEELLISKGWNRYDVHCAFDLGNLYSQRMESARAQGFSEEMRENALKAVEAYTDALRSNPSYNELFEARARAFRLLQREEEANQDIKMALILQPLRPPTRSLENEKDLYSIVREEAHKGQWKEAHAHAEELILLHPEDPLPRLMSADTAAQLGDDAVAIRRYREFLSKNPSHSEAAENLAIVLERQGKHEEAIALRRAKP